MTKHVATCKNTADGREQESMEGEPTASRSEARTVRQLIGEAAALGNNARTVGQPTGEMTGTQSLQTITDTVMEERRVEETPLNTWEQVPQCLSPERCEVTGESSKCAGKACQQEVAEEPPQDHTSDQEGTKDKESLSEANQRADQMEFIREFQEVMNKAIEQLLNKPARRHSCQK